MASAQNLVRAVADVVSVEGWSDADGDTLSIHADVSFRSAAVGGDAGDQVRFRLSLKRAEFVSIVPPTEDVKILPATVAREKFRTSVELTTTRQSETARTSRFSLAGLISATGSRATASGELGRTKALTESEVMSETQSSAGIAVAQRIGADGAYRWEMVPTSGEILRGSGWDANDSPRFSVLRPENSKLSHCLKFQIRCLREDLKLDEIEIVGPTGEVHPLFGPDERTKRAAAEAFIKTKLAEAGLISGDLSNPYAEICLLETMVEIS